MLKGISFIFLPIVLLSSMIILSIFLVLSAMFFILNLPLKPIYTYYIKKRLKEIEEEYVHRYNTDFYKDGYIVISGGLINLSWEMPYNILCIKGFVNDVKTKIGSLDAYSDNIKNLDFISNIKSKTGSVYFNALKNNSGILKNIHLYNLSSLDIIEIESLLSLNITENQKQIILFKYQNKLFQTNSSNN